ncbi:class I SAM-dependent methyltransferase [Leptospira montravelensis]|uniref:Class I SAM-dependent methyltransferase n=1 Tax=Leptospira montravelensis TaxID=2484961 RepID=A0ABY2LQK7_9LEPT|nr:class I SAM-dependent methyltransferase [Leptospira montravelensis]TGL02363.1 class I SAM-dependent methyltransferase [Leptospira montravelensis]
MSLTKRKINLDKNAKTFNLESEKYFLNRPRYPLELYSFINKHCNGNKLAWDCACGNGQVAIDLASYFEKIEASDINENQIINSFKHEKINYSIQNSENTYFPNNYFDLICAAQCLHWFNFQIYFNEVKRTLKKNGLFVTWGYSFFKIDNNIDNIIDSALFKIIDPFWSDKNRILHKQYSGIEFPFTKINIPEVEMSLSWDLNQLLSYLQTWSAVKLYIDKYSDHLLENLRQLLSGHWPENSKKKIKMDFFCYFGYNE